MALPPGTRLGVYEVIAQIGVGGMGEVYKATDTKLKRQVAIKILPLSLAVDQDRLARFRREAEVLASLNHPNIAAIYGLDESGGMTALVMELVEGEDLSQRIAGGALPPSEALPIAKQITEALEAAHEHGIIHRDLKPANIKVRSDGTVKVLDFGLAKAMEPASALRASAGQALGGLDGVALSQSPTITTPAMMTGAGVILGTAAYMSPEQARGKTVDKRADIWAFGCVLFEMLTGKRAFAGDEVQDTFVAIMRDEPDWARLPATLSPALGTYLRRCLHKDPRQRIHDIADVRLALEGAFETAALPTKSSSTPRGRLAWMAAFAVAAMVIVTVALAIPYLRSVRADEWPMRFSVTLPPGINFGTGPNQVVPAVSPDGHRLAFVAAAKAGGVNQLWVRSLDSLTAEPLAGTEGAPRSPFWSPDGRTLGFSSADGKLKAVDAAGGPVQVLSDVPGGFIYGGTWGRDGVIVFGTAGAGLFTVPAAGGQPAALTAPDGSRGEQAHRYPSLLPDGRHVLYLATPSNTVWVGSLDRTAPTRLIRTPSQAEYAAPGYLLFRRQNTLMAQPFDARRLAVTGDAVPVPLADGLASDSNGWSAFSVSDTGILIYRTGLDTVMTQLVWTDSSGRSLGTLALPGRYRNPVLSPDGTRVAVEMLDPQTRTFDIWLVEVSRGVSTRFTFDPGNDIYPVWSPDGNSIVFASDRDGGVLNLYQKRSNGAGGEDRLAKTESIEPMSWTPDGGTLVYETVGKIPTATGILPLRGPRTPQSLELSKVNNFVGQVSPDGRWLAYVSLESGRAEVYITSFPAATGGKWQISKDGANRPKWRQDRPDLMYYAFDGRLMTVPVTGREALTVGVPMPLFEPHVLIGPAPIAGFRAQYDLTPDGRRFLLNVPTEQGESSAITVLLNWAAALKK